MRLLATKVLMVVALSGTTVPNPDYERTEVEFRRTQGMGKEPDYAITYHASGDVIYEGEENVPRMGKHKGRLGSDVFQQLSRFLLAQRDVLSCGQSCASSSSCRP